MEILILAVLGFVAWRYSVYRGLVLVRAYLYLKMLSEGLNSAEANVVAMKLTTQQAGEHMFEAKRFVTQVSKGSQMETIFQAQNVGFVGGDFLDRLWRNKQAN